MTRTNGTRLTDRAAATDGSGLARGATRMLKLVARPLLALSAALDGARQRAERRYSRKSAATLDATGRLVIVRKRQRRFYERTRASVFGGFLLVDDDGGQIAFGFMLLLVVVFMFFALAVDTGIWALDHRTAQNQVDAAAHAAAFELPNTTAARNAAEDWLARNGIPSPAATQCTDGSGTWWFRSDTDSDGAHDRVDVCQRRSSEVVFSALTGVIDVRISARAAARQYEEILPYALMAMNEDTSPCQPALDVSGNGGITITGGGATYTRLDCDPALNVVGNGGLESAGNDVVGEARTTGNGGISPAANENFEWLPDPFGHLSQPAAPSTLGTLSGGVMTPGRFQNAVTIGGNVVMQPGVYVFQSGLTMSSPSSSLVSNGEVLIYSTCNPSPCNGSRPRPIDMEGGRVELTGHSGYEGILFWLDRTAQVHANNRIKLAGRANWDLNGLIYAISSDVQISGQGGQSFTLNMSVIANTVDVSGNGAINIPWDEDHAIKIERLALVE